MPQGRGCQLAACAECYMLRGPWQDISLLQLPVYLDCLYEFSCIKGSSCASCPLGNCSREAFSWGAAQIAGGACTHLQ